MSRKPIKAEDFLTKLNEIETPAPSSGSDRVAAAATAPPPKTKGRPPKRQGGSRTGLKHIGGYVDDAAAEQFALLKIRTKLGNDDLLTRMIDTYFRAQKAKRKFGD